MKRKILMGLLAAVCLCTPGCAADAQHKPVMPTIRPAVEGILAAFKTHPIVALGDEHGSAQEEDFYAALVRTPGFAREIGNVVVEFGGAAHQDILDRYVGGQDVPYAELQKVWTDVVGWVPTVHSLGYMNFFAQVRATNLKLPTGIRIHVWLGDPAIDWSKIKKQSDWFPVLGRRDLHAAQVINREILAKHRKALVIYGDLHFHGDNSLRALVEKEHPSTFFLVTLYTGYVSKSCTATFERGAQRWPVPGLAFPVRGTVLEHEMHRPGCDVVPRNSWLFTGPNQSEAKKEKTVNENEDRLSGAASDAILFLGPAASLTKSPDDPTLYLDPDRRKEIDRRVQIMTGSHLTDLTVEDNPVALRHLRP